jgi:hypothetical protein
MRRLRQLSGVWRLVLLVIGDIAVAIIAYELAWHIRTLSGLGIFEAPLSEDTLVNVPHSYWAVVLSQIVLFSFAGLYRVKNFTPKRTLLRIPPTLFLQMMFLGFLYRVSFLLQVPGFYPGPPSTFFTIFLVFWVLNSIFTNLWRTLTFYPGPLSIFFGKLSGREDLARIFIVGFMILLISCAILLAFQAQKTKKLITIGKTVEAEKIVEAEKTVEEIANVAYSLLVLGVGMRFISMVRRKNE